MTLEANISIVLYKQTKLDINELIKSCILASDVKYIYLIDNSPTDKLCHEIDSNKKLRYIFSGKNIGFGAGHNLALKRTLLDGVKYHFIVNPDITCTPDVFKNLLDYMQSNKNIGMVAPCVLNTNLSLQYNAKLLPNPILSFIRRFMKNSFQKLNSQYELKNIKNDEVMNVPFLSGCFQLLSCDVIDDVGGFDERFFMYMEDLDLSRRIHESYKTIYYPFSKVIHKGEYASRRFNKLFVFHLISAFKYYCKWGWVIDQKRKNINRNFCEKYNLF